MGFLQPAARLSVHCANLFDPAARDFVGTFRRQDLGEQTLGSDCLGSNPINLVMMRVLK